MSNEALYANHRWLSLCKPGMYVANISMSLSGRLDRECCWHIHADCVVDDFGDLQPISFTGLDSRGRCFNTETHSMEPIIPSNVRHSVQKVLA